MRRFAGCLPTVTAVALAVVPGLVWPRIWRGQARSSCLNPASRAPRCRRSLPHQLKLKRLMHRLSKERYSRMQPFSVGSPRLPISPLKTPASLGCVYRLVSTIVAGCNPNTVTEDPTGGSQTIAIVDAFDDPYAMSDLNAFSAQFGLPGGELNDLQSSIRHRSSPPEDPTGGWEGEVSLDDPEMTQRWRPERTSSWWKPLRILTPTCMRLRAWPVIVWPRAAAAKSRWVGDRPS